MPDPFIAPLGTPLLSVRKLCVSFRTPAGTVRAVDQLSFDVLPGEILGVVGESGSGKSISMLAVMGLILHPNASVDGSILYKGQELLGLPRRELLKLRGSEMAMIFQDPMTALTPVYTVGWQIVEQIRAHEKLTSRAARQRAIDLLAKTGMPDPELQFDRFPHQLSGGMRQRAMIAMALSCKPSLLIADEPTTALDVTVQAQILEIIDRMRHESGTAVVLITHDMGVVAELADRVMVMYAGRPVETGGKADLFGDAWHPYTWGLLGSIPPITGPRPHRLPSIDGAPPSLSALPAGCAFAPRCAWRFERCADRPEPLGMSDHESACFLPAGDRSADRLAFLANRKPSS